MPSSLGGSLKLGWSRGGGCSGEVWSGREKGGTGIGGFGGEQLLRDDLREGTARLGWGWLSRTLKWDLGLFLGQGRAGLKARPGCWGTVDKGGAEASDSQLA